MAKIAIRNLDGEIKTRLRMRAAENGHIMEEEAGRILREAVTRRLRLRGFASIMRARFGPSNGVELELPPRGSNRGHRAFSRYGGGHAKCA